MLQGIRPSGTRELRTGLLTSSTSLKTCSGIVKTESTEHHAPGSRREGTGVLPRPAAGAGASCPGSKRQGQARQAKVTSAREGRNEAARLPLCPGAAPVPPEPRSRSFPWPVSVPLVPSPAHTGDGWGSLVRVTSVSDARFLSPRDRVRSECTSLTSPHVQNQTQKTGTGHMAKAWETLYMFVL